MHNTQFEALSGQRLRVHSIPDQPLGLKSNRQAGYSLPELAIVILIIGLLASLAALLLPGIFASFRANKITESQPSHSRDPDGLPESDLFQRPDPAQVAQNRWVGGGMTEATNGVPTATC